MTEASRGGAGNAESGGPRGRRRSRPAALWEAGPILDRLVELRVFGRKPVGEAPPYSTDERAADLVVAHVGHPPMRSLSLRTPDGWTFHWRKPTSARGQTKGKATARYVRMVSAAAPTRPLAICRAALKLLGPIDSAAAALKKPTR